MNYSLVEALRYATSDLPFGRLLEKAIWQQKGFHPTPESPTPADNALGGTHWLDQIKAVDPTASHLAVRHLHNAAAVLAGTAGPEVLADDFHSDQSPFVQFLKGRLTGPRVKPPLSPLEPLSLSQEPETESKPLSARESLSRKVTAELSKVRPAGVPPPPTELAAKLRRLPPSKD